MNFCRGSCLESPDDLRDLVGSVLGAQQRAHCLRWVVGTWHELDHPGPIFACLTGAGGPASAEERPRHRVSFRGD